MKTVKQRNMVNRQMKPAIGDELHTLFHPIVNATKQADEGTRKEPAPMKKTLTDIDEALNRTAGSKNIDTTFGIYTGQDGQLGMGGKVVRFDRNGKILTADDTEYKFTPGLRALVTLKQPQSTRWNSNDYREYKKLVAQTKVRSFPNRTGNTRPHATWKWKKLLKKMVIPTERITEGEEEEGSGDTDDTDTASIGDIGESSDILAFDVSSPDYGIPQSPVHTRSYGKAKKTKGSEPFYKGRGVVYLPGDINGLTKKLHLFAAEFFAGNTSQERIGPCIGRIA